VLSHVVFGCNGQPRLARAAEKTLRGMWKANVAIKAEMEMLLKGGIAYDLQVDIVFIIPDGFSLHIK
jgi:hypothetical protein